MTGFCLDIMSTLTYKFTHKEILHTDRSMSIFDVSCAKEENTFVLGEQGIPRLVVL